MTHSPVRILVVDDNEALRENLVEALVLEGYDVASEPDGAAALRRLEREPFEGVLLDLMMPGMDGREVLARIRQDGRHAQLRVVMTTGYSGPAARAGLPADAFLIRAERSARVAGAKSKHAPWDAWRPSTSGRSAPLRSGRTESFRCFRIATGRLVLLGHFVRLLRAPMLSLRRAGSSLRCSTHLK